MKRDLILGDCIERMRTMEDNSIDSVVTDPPYELNFMGKSWDATGIANNIEMWKECLRVLKPGGHLLAFSGTRTYHRMACAIEDAGFEIRDQLGWMYGSGFPKSHDVSKALDKAAGAEREVLGKRTDGRYAYEFNGTANRPSGGAAGSEDADRIGGFVGNKGVITAPATDEAKQWQGWGTALKPAWEPICLARKPLIGTVAENVMKHGTGAINIDACRVGTEIRQNAQKGGENLNQLSRPNGNDADDAKGVGAYGVGAKQVTTGYVEVEGRWPANIIHDGSDEVLAVFPDVHSAGHARDGSTAVVAENYDASSYMLGANRNMRRLGDDGSAARFFYCAKVSKKERGEGNNHPTVKPIALMKYLCRLVTPPNGTVLDPFMGSGSTGIAALNEGFNFIGIEKEQEYLDIATKRMSSNISIMDFIE